MTQVYVREGFLSPKECEEAIALFPPPQVGSVNVVRESGVVAALVKATVRRSRTSFLTSTDWPLAHRMFDAFRRANDLSFDFDLKRIEPMQLAEYREGDEYDWHLDLGPDAELRKLSASVQVTDPNEYEGGDLELWHTPPIPRGQGALIIFPSYLAHRVTPVSRGTRRSLVAWAVGDRAFR